MKNPSVSVIIPCYNGAKFLERSVGCALSQTYSDIECIIVDDASTDNTREVAEAFAKKDARVRYLLNTETHGVSGVRNFGFKHAKGEWIQFYDVDDYLYPEKIKRQLDYIEKQNVDEKQDVVIYSDYEIIWEDSAGNQDRKESHKVGLHSNKAFLEKIMSRAGGQWMPFHLNTLLFKKDTFGKQLFDEQLVAFEEIELFANLLLKNVKFEYVPFKAMAYCKHDSNITTTNRKRNEKGYIQFLEKLYKQDPALLQLAAIRIGELLQRTLLEKDRETYHKLLDLVRKGNVPTKIRYKSIYLKNPKLMQFVFHFNLVASPLIEQLARLKRESAIWSNNQKQ